MCAGWTEAWRWVDKWSLFSFLCCVFGIVRNLLCLSFCGYVPVKVLLPLLLPCELAVNVEYIQALKQLINN